MTQSDPSRGKSIAQTGDGNTAQIGSGTQTVTHGEKRPPAERAKFFVVGVFLLLVAVGMAIWGFALGTLTADQRQILLWALPLASGFGCGSFAGAISAKGKGLIPGLIVTATGGFAVWLITIFVLFPSRPPTAVPGTTLPAPTSPPASTA